MKKPKCLVIELDEHMEHPSLQINVPENKMFVDMNVYGGLYQKEQYTQLDLLVL